MKKPFYLITALICILMLTGVSQFYLRINKGHVIRPEKLSISHPSDSSLVNLNSADSEQLQTLPGIGKKLAQNIIAYRASVGTIRDYTELLNIEGIGESRLNAILPYITLGG